MQLPDIRYSRRKQGGKEIGNIVARWAMRGQARFRFNTGTKDPGEARRLAEAKQREVCAAPAAQFSGPEAPLPPVPPSDAPSDTGAPRDTGDSTCGTWAGDALNAAMGHDAQTLEIEDAAPPPIQTGGDAAAANLMADMFGRTVFHLHVSLNNFVLGKLRHPDDVARFKNEVADKLMEQGWLEGFRRWMGPSEAGPLTKVGLGMACYLSVGLASIPKREEDTVATAPKRAPEPAPQPEPEPEAPTPPATPPPLHKPTTTHDNAYGAWGGNPALA